MVSAAFPQMGATGAGVTIGQEVTSMPIDVERARRGTPAASRVLDFNNAGAALMPAPVLQAQLRHLRLEAETGEGKPAPEIVAALRQRRVNCHESPGSTPLDARARRLPDLVRASVHYYNTEEEVARFASAVAALT
jgi:selenocysteine lyase/cysteine desulfurase